MFSWDVWKGAEEYTGGKDNRPLAYHPTSEEGLALICIDVTRTLRLQFRGCSWRNKAKTPPRAEPEAALEETTWRAGYFEIR